jgi:thiol:disulfide interchange protein
VDPAAAGEVTIEAEVDYLVCHESCIPGRAALTRTVPVEAEGRPAESPEVARFDAWAEQVPRHAHETGVALEMALSQTAVRPGDEFTVALGVVVCVGPPAPGETCTSWRAPSDVSLAFVPDRLDSISLSAVAEAAHPSVYAGRVIGLAGRADLDDPGADQRLVGVLFLESPEGERLTLCVDEVLPRARRGADAASLEHPLLAALGVVVGPTVGSGPGGADESEGTVGLLVGAPGGLTFWMALLYAFLGGIILNVMPCVFPVLSIKVFALVEMVQKHRRQILAHGVSYTLGILAAMWALAGVVIAVQSGGTSLGWGFQFQHPLFVALVGGVLVVFAMWLFGSFEVSVTAGRLGAVADQATGYRRSFFEGTLAVVLATPCAGPFLGMAAGFALAAPPPTTVAMFSAIGLGLAFPFVLLSLMPRLAALLPRPGRWMEIAKQIRGFGVLVVVVWLLSIMGSLAGPGGMVDMVGFLLAVGGAFWLLGVGQRARRRGVLAWVAALVVLGAAAFATLDFSPKAEGPIVWQAWSEDAVAGELEAGRPVFIDFTADWCVTCQATKSLVIETERVVRAFQANDVATFRADWTAPDERIRRKLAEFGRGGVPMYLVYSPEHPTQPRLLPEVITIDMLVQALEDAANGHQPGSI